MPYLDFIYKQAWWDYDWRRFEVEFSRRPFPVRVDLVQGMMVDEYSEDRNSIAYDAQFFKRPSP